MGLNNWKRVLGSIGVPKPCSKAPKVGLKAGFRVLGLAYFLRD